MNLEIKVFKKYLLLSYHYCSPQNCPIYYLDITEVVVYRSDLLEQLFTPEEARRTREALVKVLFLFALTASEMEKLNGKVALITGNNLSSICLI